MILVIECHSSAPFANSVPSVRVRSSPVSDLFFVLLLGSVFGSVFYFTTLYPDPSLTDMGTAMVLVTLGEWSLQGISSFQGTLVQTLSGTENRFVASSGIRLFSESGIGYYTSFPPGSAVLAWLALMATSLSPTPGFLQGLAAVIHFAASIAFYLVLRLSFDPDNISSTVRTVARCLAALYLFLPASYWYLAHSYSWDSLWVSVWMLQMLALVMIDCRRGHRILLVALSVVLTFWGTYSSHLYLCCCLGAAVFILTMAGSLRKRILFLILIGAGACGALGLAFWQNCQIAGASAYLDQLVAAEASRHSGRELPETLFQVLGNFQVAYQDLLVLIFLLGLWVAVESRCRTKRPDCILGAHRRTACRLLLTCTLPPLLINISLSEWSAEHPYSIVGYSAPLLVLAGYLSLAFLQMQSAGIRRIALVAVLALLVVSSLAASYSVYISPARVAGKRLTRLATALIPLIHPDEVVLAISEVWLPAPVTWLVGRNIQTVTSTEAARSWLAAHPPRANAVLFRIGQQHQLLGCERIRPSSETPEPCSS